MSISGVKFANTGQRDSSQLFVHLLIDILKARGAQVQQQLKTFLEFVDLVNLPFPASHWSHCPCWATPGLGKMKMAQPCRSALGLGVVKFCGHCGLGATLLVAT